MGPRREGSAMEELTTSGEVEAPPDDDVVAEIDETSPSGET